jgi:hypothetical protein
LIGPNVDIRIALLELSGEPPVSRHRFVHEDPSVGQKKRACARASDEGSGGVPLGDPGRPGTVELKQRQRAWVLVETGNIHEVRRRDFIDGNRWQKLDAVLALDRLPAQAGEPNVEQATAPRLTRPRPVRHLEGVQKSGRG